MKKLARIFIVISLIFGLTSGFQHMVALAETLEPEARPYPNANTDTEMIIDLTPNWPYLVNGTLVTTDETGSIPIDESWLGKSFSLVKKGNGTTTTDSEPYNGALQARPATPSGVGTSNETYPSAGDGSLNNVTSQMQYKATTSSAWINITGTTVTGLAPATYEVRMKPTWNKVASFPVTVTVGTTQAVPEVKPTPKANAFTEILYDLTPNATYTINGTLVIADETGIIPIDESWFGISLSVVKKGNGTTTTDSQAYTGTMPARQAVPSGVGTSNESYPSANDGRITGVTTAMEYKATTTSNWNSVSGAMVAGLASGTYEVRVKATSGKFASLPVTVTVGTTPATPEVKPLPKANAFTEMIYDLTPNATYAINGTLVIADETGSIRIDESWFGISFSIVKKGNGTTTTDSQAYTTPMPARQAAPSGVGTSNESYPSAGDGSLTGVSSAMEYKSITSSTWIAITGTTVTGLAPASYEVRVKATSTAFASLPVTVTVGTTSATSEVTPTASIDYAGEKLTGLTPNSAYKVNGTEVTADSSGHIAINSSWLGTDISLVKSGNGTTLLDSAAQTVEIAARPATPSGVSATNETYPAAGDGTITGVSSTLEYKATTVNTWISISGSSVTGLGAATYEVRMKATTSNFASLPVTVTVDTTAAIKETKPLPQANPFTETIGNLIPNAQYLINGTQITADETGTVSIDENWIGLPITIVKKGNGTTTIDSDTYTSSVPARPATPSGVAATNESYPEADDGRITGVTTAMEYKLATSHTWISISGTTVTDLEAASYEVRVKAKTSAFASLPVTVIVGTTPATPEATPSVSVDYINEQLIGFVPNGSYKVNGTAVTADGTGKLAMDESWIGQTLFIVKKGNGTTTLDSSEQMLYAIFRLLPINEVAAVEETYPNAGDGSIIVGDVGLNREYKLSTASTWSDVVGGLVTGLVPGTYEVRVKAFEGYFASPSLTVTVGTTPATPEATPTAVIDYAAEKLTGLTANGAYKVNGTAVTADGTGSIAINNSWLGTELSLVKSGNGTTLLDSAEQTVEIAARPVTPSEVATTDETYPNAGDGSITGVTTAMEYKSATSNTWTSIAGTTVTGLDPASYEVRVKATSSTFASLPVTVTVGTTPATPEVTPTASIDYAGEKLTGLTANGAYKVNGTAVTADGTGSIPINNSWLGTELSLVKSGNGTTLLDSAAQTVEIAARPVTPSEVDTTDETYPDAGDGTITGVTTAMEYKSATSNTWTAVTGTSVTGLEPASYEVRVKATATAFASSPVTVTVGSTPATPEVTPTASIDYAAEKLTGLTANGAYKVNGTAVTADGTGSIAINNSWLGTELSLVKSGNGTTLLDSSEQTVEIAERPATPSEVDTTDETYPNAGDGSITGVTTAMEYKSATSSTWTAVTGTSVTGLEPASYEVRVKATATAFASLPVTVTVGTTPATPEVTPTAVIDYAGEKLTGLTPNGAYKVNGTAVTADGTGSIPINNSWLGTELSLVKSGNGTTLLDSAAQTLEIAARPVTPSEVDTTDETYPNAGDGSITGVTTAMEYKAITSNTWNSISGTTVNGLDPASYEVRVKATSSTFASLPVTVIVGTTPATPEVTPAASIDYAGEKLTGLTPNGAYKVNGTAVTADGTGSVAINVSWLGTELSLVKSGNGTTLLDSAAQTVEIAARPVTPSEVATTDETYPNAGDGSITGVTTAMEYKSATSSTWTAVTGTSVTGLEPASYEVRVKATSSTFASLPVTVTVGTTPATPEVTPTAVIDYAGEKLTGLTANGAYKVNGTAVTADGTGNIAINNSWLGTELSLVKSGNGTTLLDSAAQTVEIPARSGAPSEVDTTDETYPNAGDGTITGVTTVMEYKLKTSNTWTSITGTTVIGLEPATYEVRVKATATAFASLPVTVTVGSTPATLEVTPTASIDYAGEKLTGLTANGAFKVNGTAVTADGTGSIAINSSWLGTELSIVKSGNGTTLLDSAEQTIEIPARSGAPLVTANDVSNIITNLDTTMEYSINGAPFVLYDGKTKPRLNGSATVVVRVAATVTQFVSEEITLNFITNPTTATDTVPESEQELNNNDENSDESVEVIVNGKVEKAGTAHTVEVNGVKQTTIVLDEEKLQQKLETEGRNVVVTIPVVATSEVIVGQLTAQMVQNIQNQEGTIVLQTSKGSYTLPSDQISLTNLVSQLGGQPALEDIVISVTIAETTASGKQLVADTASKGGFEIAAAPIEFVLTATYGGKTIEISQFNEYVERRVTLPAGTNADRVTTGVVIEADGSVRHVPTTVNVEGTQYQAVINSLTNSMYTLIWNPISFADMEKHWAKDAVNDMGSRLIVNGISDSVFNPDADITRAEFAAIIVRGLGLKIGVGSNPFTDVASGKWYEGAIQTAVSYGLITGYNDGTFRPNDKITREQAMLIIARAMKLTGLETKTGVVDVSSVLNSFTDNEMVSAWAKDDVALVVASGLIKGHSGQLAAQAFITRAEVATIIQRLLKQSELI